MKRKGLWIKCINAGLIVLALTVYQYTVKYRQLEAKVKGYQKAVASYEKMAKEYEQAATKSVPAKAKATQDVAYRDGTYRASAQGFGGAIQVELTIADGKIAKAELLKADKEDKEYLKMAQSLLKEAVKKQRVDLDAVSGATFSSKGITGAMKKALKQAVDEQ